MAHASDTLDTLIVKATNPLVASPDSEIVSEICNRINNECEGAQVATKFIAYRMHSPQEKEALNALLLLQECVKCCGKTFHSEIGKFRFLNEMIKLVSPKYDAHRTPATIKEKVLELLYVWTLGLHDHPKILEAYDMLKKQGVVKENPPISCSTNFEPPPPRPKNPVFEDSEKQAMLQKLLRSKNPEDLQEANKLIKSMVKEDERRQEFAVRCRLELETVNNNVRLLSDLLDNLEGNGATAEELELCRELATNCQKLQSNIARLASETDEHESCFGDMLRASEDLEKVLEKSKLLHNGAAVKTIETRNSNLLVDLPSPPKGPSQSAPVSVLDDPLLSLDDRVLSSQIVLTPSLLQPLPLENHSNSLGGESLPGKIGGKVESKPKPKGLDELDLLGETLLKQNLPSSAKHSSTFHKQPDKIPLNLLAKKNEVPKTAKTLLPVVEVPASIPAPSGLSLNSLDLDSLVGGFKVASLAPTAAPKPAESSDIDSVDAILDLSLNLEPVSSSVSVPTGSLLTDDVPILQSGPVSPNPLPVTAVPQDKAMPSLSEIFVRFEDIKPGSRLSVDLLSQPDGLNAVLHSARADLPENVHVFVISTTSRFASPLSSYTFQAIVPKTFRVKLQPPSGTNLPAFNPFLPPSAITQIILIASPTPVSTIDLKFVISCEVNNETVSEFREISLSL